MTIEELEKELRNKFIKKYDKEKLINKQDFFVLQIRGVYKKKEVRFSDLIGNEIPVLIIKGETYEECFIGLINNV